MIAFEELYNSYWEKIYRLCLGYSHDQDQAKDLTQETFIAAWKNLDKFRNESQIGTWLYRIASNTCLRQIEKDKRMPLEELPLQLEQQESKSLDLEINLLYKFIGELPEVDRIIISLELEGIKQAEIADIVGLSAANIRTKIHRIKEKLTEKFRKNGK